MACRLLDETERFTETVIFLTRTDAIDHLTEHKNEGHKVPRHAFARLRKEKKELGDSLAWTPPKVKPKPKIKRKRGVIK